MIDKVELARRVLAESATGMAKVDRDFLRKGGAMTMLSSEVIPAMIAFHDVMSRISPDSTNLLFVALQEIEALGSDGEHSGDRHARCRDIARSALADWASRLQLTNCLGS